ncbi:MAG: hypothetical protein ABI205_08655 [Gemmatimonadaceae bacterium]
MMVAFGTLGAAVVCGAQRVPDSEPVCLGFSFGPWTPALDWRAAGHGAKPDSALLQHAAPGRDWAAATSGGAGNPNDSLLILFPSWWPAGVSVAISPRTPAPGDTIAGRAVALVADGGRTNPVSQIRVWRRPCGGVR